MEIEGEAASADEIVAMNYNKELTKTIDNGGYCPDQAFNADETRLFCKRRPDRCR